MLKKIKSIFLLLLMFNFSLFSASNNKLEKAALVIESVAAIVGATVGVYWIYTMANLTKAGSKDFQISRSNMSFKDIAGYENVKKEFKNIIEFLKNPSKFHKIGLRPYGGLLLSGEPGVGKTLFAKAFAGECKCDIIAVSGSDFVEVWCGVGAARVRQLFELANRSVAAGKSCIIFIDELDAIGQKRTYGGASCAEDNRILCQLLELMDGFNNKYSFDKYVGSRVFVIGATNSAVENLDPALLRPGRFDISIAIPRPDLATRKELIELNLINKPLEKDIKVDELARMTMGFTGAGIVDLINKAGLSALQSGIDKIDMNMFRLAYEKVLMGLQSGLILNEREKKLTACHEAGHALVRLLLSNSNFELIGITIQPRGRTAGVTKSLPKEEFVSWSKSQLLVEMCVYLGGYVAEEIIFNDVTSGASNDLKKATDLAINMAGKYGMSNEIGLVSIVNNQDRQLQIAAKNIIDDCYQKTKKLINDNIDKLHKLVELLLEKETVSSEEVKNYLGISV